MSEQSTPKQRIAGILKILKAHNRKVCKAEQIQSPEKSFASDHARDEMLKKIHQQLKGPLRIIFRKAGLNINNDDHWHQLLIFIAWAVYCKGPGQPKSWTKKELRQILADFKNAKSVDSKLTEVAYCEKLASSQSEHIKYFDLKPGTLRRRLQQAKKLDLQQPM